MKSVKWGLKEEDITKIDTLQKYFHRVAEGKRSAAYAAAYELASETQRKFYRDLNLLYNLENDNRALNAVTKKIQAAGGVVTKEHADQIASNKISIEKKKKDIDGQLKPNEADTREIENLKRYLTAQLMEMAYFPSSEVKDSVIDYNTDDFSLFKDEVYIDHKSAAADALIDEINNSVTLKEKPAIVLSNYWQGLKAYFTKLMDRFMQWIKGSPSQIAADNTVSQEANDGSVEKVDDQNTQQGTAAPAMLAESSQLGSDPSSHAQVMGAISGDGTRLAKDIEYDKVEDEGSDNDDELDMQADVEDVEKEFDPEKEALIEIAKEMRDELVDVLYKRLHAELITAKYGSNNPLAEEESLKLIIQKHEEIYADTNYPAFAMVSNPDIRKKVFNISSMIKALNKFVKNIEEASENNLIDIIGKHKNEHIRIDAASTAKRTNAKASTNHSSVKRTERNFLAIINEYEDKLAKRNTSPVFNRS